MVGYCAIRKGIQQLDDIETHDEVVMPMGLC
jgi:hypothetical protein